MVTPMPMRNLWPVLLSFLLTGPLCALVSSIRHDTPQELPTMLAYRPTPPPGFHASGHETDEMTWEELHRKVKALKKKYLPSP